MKHFPDILGEPDRVGAAWDVNLKGLCVLGCIGFISCSIAPQGKANPTGASVTHGAATITSQGSQLTVQTSDRAFINWQSFNIGALESTVFLQPSSSSLVWNRINDPNPSQILGQLDANGIVILQNQSGFYVGSHALINAGGLVMTTSPISPPDFMTASMWNFSAPPPAASIINYGQLNIGSGGSAFLIARNVENHGAITAPAGDIGLYAGKQVLVSERPDGRGLSAQVSLPEGSVDNSGRLIADAGTIALHAQVVNQGGLIQANSVRQQNGVIELVASDALKLGASSDIEAKGDAAGKSPGGNVLVQSGSTFSDAPTSTINVSGGAEGGQGGQVEISAPRMGAIQSKISAAAQAGSLDGKLIIDPLNITLSSTGDNAASGTINAGDPPDTLNLNVASFAGFSQILLQASQNITVATLWNLGDSTDLNSKLTLQAGNNITVNSSAGIQAGKNWTLNLIAGADFTAPTSVVSGQGGIYLNGSGFLQASQGNQATLGTVTLNGRSVVFDGTINLLAGKEILVNLGAIRTVGGGGIVAAALSGNVNTGINANGYNFSSSGAGYTVSPALGGISTKAGGDLTIAAGEDVSSLLPTGNLRNQTDAGSGAFGPEPGNVTISAGGNVFGHYVEANGVGMISAGQNVGSTTKPLALSLVKGSWDVEAPNGSIYLQEVRNPNGIFNNIGGAGNSTYHLFNYDPDSSVTLDAGNSVQLTGQNLPRLSGDVSIPAIYPPSLAIQARAGGIILGSDLILFPSPDGNLNLATTGGGSLESSQAGVTHSLTMSDSGKNNFTTPTDFGPGDHAAIPVQLNNPQPVVIDISGDIKDMQIATPKVTQITVHGEMDNSSFSGQNLHSSDVTFINVAGRIFNRSDYTFVTLGQNQTYNPTAAEQIFANAVAINSDGTVQVQGDGTPVRLFGGNPGLFYLPDTKQLGFQGQMGLTLEQELLNNNKSFQVLQYGPDGNLLVDAAGHYVVKTMNLVDPSVITALYAESQNVPRNSGQGYQIGGPGQFNINATSLDLGVTQGLISNGPFINHALAGLGIGAAINLNLTGDLSMYSSTIASYFGGDINIYSGGAINVGNENLLGSSSDAARGIYSSGHGSVSVIAQGNIDVAGSRIAAYDGGNIFVKSLTGNVNAGNGNQGQANVPDITIDPVTGQVSSTSQPIAGSGILATTLPDAPISENVGNITVETPQGNIVASEGGIVQAPLNGNVAPGPKVTLVAGTQDSAGKVVYAGNIDVTGSGVIGGTVDLTAAGSINGLVVARQDTLISAVTSFSGTVFAVGTANVNAGGDISGTIIGVGGINASGGGSVSASLLSQNITVGGAQVGSGLATSVAASSTSQSAVQETTAQKTESTQQLASADDDETKKRAGKRPLLAKSTGRVTVILPTR